MSFKEECMFIVGKRFGGFYIGWGVNHTQGTFGQVAFDYDKVMEWEKSRWDFLGFWHTHPNGVGTMPSQTDLDTMDGWINCLGRPLLCMIGCEKFLTSWKFCLTDKPKVVKNEPVFKIWKLFFGTI